MSFKENSYEVIRNAIPQEMVIYINSLIEMGRKLTYLSRGLDPNDENLKYMFSDEESEGIKKCFASYGSFCTETLLLFLHKKVEEVTGKELLPTYSYARQYYKGATMAWHMDRETCEYSVTICLSRPEDDLYPIWFESNDSPPKNLEIILNPGDMIVYSGIKLPHWREEYTGEVMTQAFLHYVDANGPYKNHIFDQRPYLGFPASSKVSIEEDTLPNWKKAKN